MPATIVRPLRVLSVFGSAMGVFWLRFSAGIVRETEADPFVHWALLAVGMLLGLAGAAFEVNDSGPLARRDALLGLSGALILFSALRFFGTV